MTHQRQIKFRAFDKNDGMFYNIQDGIQFDDGSKYTFDRFLTKSDDDFHDWTIMQFVWETDSEGTEVYEGDVYEYDYEYDSDYDGDMPIVKRSTGRGYVKDIFDTFRIKEAKSEGGKVKVIGNIHSNPELLKP